MVAVVAVDSASALRPILLLTVAVMDLVLRKPNAHTKKGSGMVKPVTKIKKAESMYE